jgi:tetratricopeptide (TPR) repeat protein
MAFGILGFGTLGLLCKESAALLPLFVLTLELTLFVDEAPWRYRLRLSARTRGAILAALLVIATGMLVWAINLFMPLYAARDFTMSERLLTESRVLVFYLSLILFPRINGFGLHHDDILLSTSLITPWTTLPAILGLIGLLVWAYLARKELPLLTLGVLWFFVGHLLESTIIPLEITHEHRNYLAGVGILLAVICLLDYGHRKLNRKVWIIYPVFASILVGTTLLRATQWSDYNSLTRYQAFHHPKSARAQGMLSSLLYAQDDYEQAMTAIQNAAALKPNEAGYKINMHVLALRLGTPLSPSVHEDILKLLATRPPSAFTQISLNFIVGCIASGCSELQNHMEVWLRTLVENLPPRFDASLFYYQLGRTLIAQGKILDGLNTLEQAYKADPNYLHPLFELANVFLSLRQIENAELILERIRKANESNLHPRDKEIAELADVIKKLKTNAGEGS